MFPLTIESIKTGLKKIKRLVGLPLFLSVFPTLKTKTNITIKVSDSTCYLPAVLTLHVDKTA